MEQKSCLEEMARPSLERSRRERVTRVCTLSPGTPRLPGAVQPHAEVNDHTMSALRSYRTLEWRKHKE